MGHEANITLIRALEKQIEEDKVDLIKLKRARNSLLNISTRVPPEILGYVFVWSIFRESGLSLESPSNFSGLKEGSYNFILVCHHWFEVASNTPELWIFWGNVLQDWKKRHHRSGVAPLDLVLRRPDGTEDYGSFFDEPLRGALRRRVKQDTIRRAHILTDDYDLLTSVISSLTPDGEGGQNENIESIIWVNKGPATVDISNFFSRSCLSRLHLLDLGGDFWISSWDWLASGTTLLTSLSLELDRALPPPTPTTSQLFSILRSNPNLRELRLSDTSLPNDADGSTYQVPLRNLKMLSLTGEFRHIFRLLHRLILPQALDKIYLIALNPTMEDISQTFAPYMEGYFRRDARFQGPLAIYSSSSYRSISISVQATAPAPEVSFMVILADAPPPNVLEQFFINLIAPIPRELVTSFTAGLGMKLPEELLFVMPNIGKLSIHGMELSKGFLQPDPDGPHAKTKLLPSLRSLFLKNISLSDGSWSHLTTYLAQQTSDKQITLLRVFGDVPYLHSEVVDEIRGRVREFVYL